jgi:lipopolysaccharide biosynthesis glycosyltransferase
MKHLIYQYYDGPVLPGTLASVNNIKKYADRIGAEYLFEENPNWIKGQNRNLGRYTPHYGQFKIIYEDFFDNYDSVLFLDSDIFAVENLEENIFNNDVGHIGICTEGLQPELRKKIKKGPISHISDEKFNQVIKHVYNRELPRTETGLLKVYNSGVVLYTKEGRHYCKRNFVNFEKFARLIKSAGLDGFYASDQGYIHAMLEAINISWKELHPGWNSYVHYKPETSGPNRPVIDTRTTDTKFVHVQLRAADHFDGDKLWRITNLDSSKWDLNN